MSTRSRRRRSAAGSVVRGEQLAVDLADGVEFLARVSQRVGQLEELTARVFELAAQFVGGRGAGAELVGEVASERLGEPLL